MRPTAASSPTSRTRPHYSSRGTPALPDVFAEFDQTPIAAASIGQVYWARRRDGTEVVVKVRRPGVVEHVKVDLLILARLARYIDRYWRPARRIGIAALVDEFGSMLRRELDYVVEATNAERFTHNLCDSPSIVIPKIHAEDSTGSVITLDFVPGARVDDMVALHAAGVSPQDVAARITDLFLKMIFNDGFFHADPHPGNLLVDDHGNIGLIDFGMVGELTPQRRQTLAGLLTAMVSNDIDGVVDHFISLGVTAGPTDRFALRHDLESLMRNYLEQPLGALRLGVMLQDHLSVARVHHLRLPPELALLTKTLMMCEGLAARARPRLPDAQRSRHLAPEPHIRAEQPGALGHVDFLSPPATAFEAATASCSDTGPAFDLGCARPVLLHGDLPGSQAPVERPARPDGFRRPNLPAAGEVHDRPRDQHPHRHHQQPHPSPTTIPPHHRCTLLDSLYLPPSNSSDRTTGTAESPFPSRRTPGPARDRLRECCRVGAESMSQTAALLAATIMTGLIAGVFALYAHTIMPGLGRTDDRTFVGAFQSIDRATINAWFIPTCPRRAGAHRRGRSCSTSPGTVDQCCPGSSPRFFCTSAEVADDAMRDDGKFRRFLAANPAAKRTDTDQHQMYDADNWTCIEQVNQHQAALVNTVF